MNVFEWIIQYSSVFGLLDLLDIALVAFVVYQLIRLIRRSSAGKALMGVVLLFVVLQLAQLFELRVISYLLANTLQMGLIALVIVFQPEIRKALEKVGRRNILKGLEREEHNVMDTAIVQAVEACSAMAKARDGALVVFEREIELRDIIKTGTVLDAYPSAEFLKNIFFPKAPMHDGAVIVQQGRIAAAGCMLPLSANENLSKDLGMRHRAGVGMSENSDAVVVIVSEETGSISVAIGGMLKRHLAPETLEKLLRNELMPQQEENKKVGILSNLLGLLRVKR